MLKICFATIDVVRMWSLTIELGQVGNKNPFKQYYESLPKKQISLSFKAEFMALFYYADGPIEKGSFICYKVLPLSG